MAEALRIAEAIAERGINSVVFDSAPRSGSAASHRPSAARRIAEAMGGAYYPVRAISGQEIAMRVTDSTQAGAAQTAGR